MGSRILAYDGNGNLISDAFTKTTNTWNYRNELKTSVRSSASASYGYDSSGLRVFETANNITTVFPTPSFTVTGATTTIAIEVIGMPIATIEKVGTNVPKIFASHTDHLGSTRLATDQTGAIVEKTDYDAFGKITTHTQSGDFAERKKFTSHEFDSSTNYTYAKARYLNTEVGRFVSEDPAFLLVGSKEFDGRYNRSLESFLSDPQLLNSYSYARNNPVKFTDADGECVTDPASAAICAAVIIGLTNLAFALSNYITALGGIDLAAFQVHQAIQTFNNPQAGSFQRGVAIAGILPFGGPADDIAKYGDDAAKALKGLVEEGEKIVVAGKQLTRHALEQMIERKASISEVENIITSSKPFEYFHEGISKIGYYSEKAKIFVGEVVGKDLVTTVITNVKQNYINNLKNLPRP